MQIVKWADRTIRLGFFLLFLIVPLILTSVNYELFEFNKMLVTYGLTIIIVSAWLIKSIVIGEFRLAKTPLNIPILLFLASQIVSSLFSLDPHVSWFGYYSRFNGGVFSIISYAFLYFIYVSNFTHTTNLLKIALATAIAVSFYGVLEHLGIDKNIWVQDVQNRVFSTLGQPNWLAAYLAALIPVALAFALNRRSPEGKLAPSFLKNRITNLGFSLWLAVAGLFFLVILFTKSRSGFLGLVIADLVLWILLFFKYQKQKFLYKSFIICHIVFLALSLWIKTPFDEINKFLRFNTFKNSDQTATASAALNNAPAPLLETGGTESGVIRKYVWQGAINTWQSSWKTKLIGTGTETFAFSFYQNKPKGHNLTSEWDFLYNKAHNEYLNYLATTGLFGLGSYLSVVVVFAFYFARVCRSSLIVNRKDELTNNDQRITFNIALFAGWISLLVTNFFGFAIVITQIFLFLFPAMIWVSSAQHSGKFIVFSIPKALSQRVRLGLVFLILLVLIALLGFLSLYWYADSLFASGYRLTYAGAQQRAYPYFLRAVALRPDEPLYHNEYAGNLASLSIAMAGAGDASSAAKLAKESLTQSDLAVSASPNNVNFWKTRTKVYFALSSLDTSFIEPTIQSLKRAHELSPFDPKILYNLALLYGRVGKSEVGIQYFKDAIDAKPNFRDAYFGLYTFYIETQRSLEARNILQEYLSKVDPNDKDFKERLK